MDNAGTLIKSRARGDALGVTRITGILILTIVLVAIYAHNAAEDRARARLLSDLDAARHLRTQDELAQAAALKERRTKKTNAAVLLGLVRGAIIGLVLGSEHMFEDMVTFGVLNGILFWASEQINEIL